MNVKIQFGVWEAVALLVNMISAKVFLGYTRVMAETAGPAGWIVSIYAAVLAIIGFILINKLYSRFEGKDILDIAGLYLGNTGRIITGTIISIYLLVMASLLLRDFSENMKTIALTDSPISFVSLFFMVGVITAAYAGIEAIVRFHALVVPIVVAGGALLILAVAPYFDMENLTPILGTGTEKIFGLGSLRISMYAELILLFLIVPFIKTNKNLRVVGYTSICISGVFLTVSTIAVLASFPYPIALENFLPLYNLSRLIQYGRFFQRVEAIFFIIWAASALLYLSTGFFFFLYTFQKTFKLEFYKPLIIPAAILTFNISLLPQSLVQAVSLLTSNFRKWLWTLTFGYVIILLFVAGIIQRGKKPSTGR